MFTIFEDEDFIQFKISTDMRHVSTLIHRIRKFLHRYSMPDDNPLVLILRDLISNAIEHGTPNTEHPGIMVSAEYTGNAVFKIMVEDEGKAFDGSHAEGDSQPLSRRLELAKRLSERMEFSTNSNCVTAWVKIPAETEFAVSSHVSEDGKTWTVIQPTGDLTAGNAPKFRNVLLDLLTGECKHYRFDLAKVNDMDSVSLSIFIKFSNLIREKHPEGQPEMVNAVADIVNLFQMTRLNRIYRVVQ